MPHVATTRGSLYFADHWRGEAVPLLLIHGAAGTHLDWSMPLRRLRSLAVDLNGHGKSPGYGRETISEHAGDMAALLDALGIDSVYACGHSMGGAVVLSLALEHPERVRGLILISTGAQLKVHPDILNRAQSNPEAVADMLFSWLWSEQTPTESRERGRALFMAQKPVVIARDYAACDSYNVRGELSRIRCPALVLCGTADVMTPPHLSETLADGLPDAELRLFEGAGHNLQLERPQEAAGALSEWLARH